MVRMTFGVEVPAESIDLQPAVAQPLGPPS
jgi:hypothetical protein